MSAKITTPFGEAVPPAPRHSVTVHMGGGWDTVEKYGTNSSSVISLFKNAYPRMKPHRDIAQLASAVLERVGDPNAGCFLFSSLQSAKECIEYAISSRRGNGGEKGPVPPEHIAARAFRAEDVFFAVLFPLGYRPTVARFWSTAGAGVSSRFAEASLDHLSQLEEIPLPENEPDRPNFSTPAHVVHPSPSVHDVYFYQTGMAAICKSHGYLLSRYNGTTVLFEIAFMNTLKAFENGPGFKFFGSGSDDDLHELQGFLQQEADQGRRVQAIWAEFPANPLLVTPNLAKLRELADKYDVVLAIDDTIGSWANIDITAMADLLVTSVTKSFNGYADAIAGSVVLNPASPKYHDLKSLFNRHYVPEFYIADAEVIEQNSRDYLWRTSKMNGNAEALVNYLHACSLDTESAVRQVHYPSVNPSGKFYKSFMRPATADFSPGYGCLFSVELDDLATTRAFYDNLNVHKGVHLGAPFTLAFAYTMCTYKSIRIISEPPSKGSQVK
ncbi:hypothetical protein DL546_003794 [Coniochaeta pulveracea]|uniref:Cystathionine gamma-synthase n=1 Tax=Coniochaeta pulveracea TaxID=177199 RepID=A0A420Y3S7_9PEZI|nr:hypothetical protein DL546_003794 [Coniochaeta pulveracea]